MRSLGRRGLAGGLGSLAGRLWSGPLPACDAGCESLGLGQSLRLCPVARAGVVSFLASGDTRPVIGRVVDVTGDAGL
ncbi:hypothetical protein GCM10009736_59530 [Actinomadura bangladeshensis]